MEDKPVPQPQGDLDPRVQALRDLIVLKDMLDGVDFTGVAYQTHTLRDSIQVLYRRKWTVIALFLLTVAAAATWTLMQAPLYESKATLLVKLGREFMNRPEVGELFVTRNASLVNAEIQIIRSYGVLSQVVGELGPEELYPELGNTEQNGTPLHRALFARIEKLWEFPSGDRKPPVASPEQTAIEKFRGSLSVSAVPDADVIKVAFRHPDPQTAATAVNLVVDRFKAKHLEAFSENQATAFLEEKVTAYRSELDKAENALKVFLQRNGSLSLDDRGGQAVLQRRREIDAERNSVASQVAGIRQKLDFLRQKQGTTSRYESFALHDELGRDIVSGLADLRFQEARLSSLDQQLARFEKEAQRLPVLTTRYRDLLRERDAKEQLYQTYARNLEDARVSQEMDRQNIANISVIEEGMAALAPVSPRKRLNLAIGILAGLILGVLAAFLLESLSPTHP